METIHSSLRVNHALFLLCCVTVHVSGWRQQLLPDHVTHPIMRLVCLDEYSYCQAVTLLSLATITSQMQDILCYHNQIIGTIHKTNIDLGCWSDYRRQWIKNCSNHIHDYWNNRCFFSLCAQSVGVSLNRPFGEIWIDEFTWLLNI